MKSEQEIINTIKSVFGSSQGRKLLRYLVRTYVFTNPKSDTQENTYMNLGKQHLVQEFIYAMNLTDNQLEEIYGDI